jgi:tripartite ATP-independent transporter DctM subunit
MEFLQLAVLLLPMVTLIALGLPIFLSMGMSCLIFTFLFDVPIMILAQSFVRGLGSYDFLALPFYFLAGDLMNAGGITSRLVNFSTAFIGHIRGGLSHVTILASMVFSGVSGSAVADASAIGSLLIPSMKREGFPSAYAAAVTAAAATIGPIIPPSIPMVVYGLLCGVSVGKLFLAGAIPGILMGVYLFIASIIISYRRGYPSRPRATLKQLVRSTKDASFALIMPLIILGGIITGIVTPTEAGVIAVAYGFGVGSLVYRELKPKDIGRIFSETMINSATVLIIIATSGLFSWIIANMGLGDAIIRVLLSISTNKWVILILINIFFLLWGCVLDPMTALIIMVPILVPLVQKLGIDAIHFGLVVIMNLMIGLVTPPVGFVLYLTSSIAKVELEKTVKELIPFLIALLLVLMVCTFFPAIVLWLPKLLMG